MCAKFIAWTDRVGATKLEIGGFTATEREIAASWNRTHLLGEKNTNRVIREKVDQPQTGDWSKASGFANANANLFLDETNVSVPVSGSATHFPSPFDSNGRNAFTTVGSAVNFQWKYSMKVQFESKKMMASYSVRYHGKEGVIGQLDSVNMKAKLWITFNFPFFFLFHDLIALFLTSTVDSSIETWAVNLAIFAAKIYSISSKLFLYDAA